MARYITIEIPKDMSDSDATTLMRDALGEFMHKRKNAYAYVEKGYAGTELAKDPGYIVSKIDEVIRRVEWASTMFDRVRVGDSEETGGLRAMFGRYYWRVQQRARLGKEDGVESVLAAACMISLDLERNG